MIQEKNKKNANISFSGNVLAVFIFLVIALMIFYYRGFLFNEYGGVKYQLINRMIPQLFFGILILLLGFYPVILRAISLEKDPKVLSGFLRKSIIHYKEIIFFYFLAVVYVLSTVIWVKIITCEGASSDMVLYNKHFHYSVYIVLFFAIIFSLIESFFIFKSTHILKQESKNISLKEITSICFVVKNFKFLIIFVYLISFLVAFLCDLLTREDFTVLLGLFEISYLFIISLFSSLIIFIAMLIVTKGIKKSLLNKISFWLLTVSILFLSSYIFFRLFWINWYIK